jgi:RNA polymerase sigma-70 factor (ECF subfamily)
MLVGRGGDDLEELIRRAKAGDVPAFEAVLRLHAHDLEAYVRRHLPPDVARVADVGDVVQDTYFEAWRRFGRFDAADGSSTARWLATIARHRIIDLVRHHRAAKRGGGAAAAGLGGGSGDELPRMLQDLAVYERTPSQSAMSHERRAALQRAMGDLRPAYQQVIRMRYLEGLPVRDAAERLGRSEHAVHMLCNRAMRELSRQLGALCSDGWAST